MPKPDYTESDLARQAEAAADLIAFLQSCHEDDDPDLVNDSIEGETDFLETIDRVLDQIAEADMMADAIADRIARLSERKRRFQTQAASLRGALQMALKLANGDRKLPFSLATPESTVTLRGVKPKVVILEESEIPAEFWEPQPPKLDRKLLNSRCTDPESLPPGVTLSEPGFTIAIRRN